MNMDDKFDYYMFILCNIDGIGYKTVKLLLDTYGSAREALSESYESYSEILTKSKAQILSAGLDKDKLNNRLKIMSKEKIKFIPFTSPEYPDKLKHIPDPPLALYVKGELPLDDAPSVAVIGARECSEYGAVCAEAIGKKLGSCGINVISGFARGIDSIAQQNAILSGGKTYGILGCGTDVIYPPENRKLYEETVRNGGLISEYAVGTLPKKTFFPARNRLISGLSDVVVVVEARVRSGTYITVTQALEQGKEVMAVPGRITDGLSVGCNVLINQGAAVITSPEDVIDMLSSMGKLSIYMNKSPNYEDEEDGCESESTILENLEITPTDCGILFDKLRKYGYTYEQMSSELTVLEIEGKVKKIGNSYIRKDVKSHI